MTKEGGWRPSRHQEDVGDPERRRGAHDSVIGDDLRALAQDLSEIQKKFLIEHDFNKIWVYNLCHHHAMDFQETQWLKFAFRHIESSVITCSYDQNPSKQNCSVTSTFQNTMVAKIAYSNLTETVLLGRWGNPWDAMMILTNPGTLFAWILLPPLENWT